MEPVPIRRGEGSFRGTPIAQILGMAAAFTIAIFLLYFGRGVGAYVLLFSGIIVYVVLRLFGVRKTKNQLAFGALLVVSAVVIGGIFVSPAFIEDAGRTEGFDVAGFSGPTVVDNGDGTYTFSVDYAAGDTVTMRIGELTSVNYMSATHGALEDEAMTEAGGTYSSLPLTLDGGKMYVYNFSSGTGDETYQLIFSGTVEGSEITMFSMKWNLYYVALNLAFAFFLIVVLVAWMRRRMEALRDRMEAEGRLFPPGYGRCSECGNLIMPGMFECRKCGTPVPEELRPKDGEMFECSECGTSVGMDETVCPGCGSSFEDDEFPGE